MPSFDITEVIEQCVATTIRAASPERWAWSENAGRCWWSVLTALGQWGSRIPISDSTNQDLSTDALIFALTTTFDADIAGQLHTTVQLRTGDDRFRAEVRHGYFRVARGDTDTADVTITTDSSTLRSLVFAGQPLAKTEAAGKATIIGDRRAAEHLLRCFSTISPARSPNLTPANRRSD